MIALITALKRRMESKWFLSIWCKFHFWAHHGAKVL